MLTPEDLANWIGENVSGCTYQEHRLKALGVDGDIDLIELCKFIDEKYKEK